MGELFIHAQAGGIFAGATDTVHVALHGVLQQHAAKRQARFQRVVLGDSGGSRFRSLHRTQVGMASCRARGHRGNFCAFAPKKTSSKLFCFEIADLADAFVIPDSCR